MDEMTQQNAALVEEASAAARAMQEQAGDLSSQVGFFCLAGDRQASEGAPQERVKEVARATEAVFAAVRKAPPRAVAAETADAGAWKEF